MLVILELMWPRKILKIPLKLKQKDLSEKSDCDLFLERRQLRLNLQDSFTQPCGLCAFRLQHPPTRNISSPNIDLSHFSLFNTLSIWQTHHLYLHLRVAPLRPVLPSKLESAENAAKPKSKPEERQG